MLYYYVIIHADYQVSHCHIQAHVQPTGIPKVLPQFYHSQWHFGVRLLLLEKPFGCAVCASIRYYYQLVVCIGLVKTG